jgi:hypothetical protein
MQTFEIVITDEGEILVGEKPEMTDVDAMAEDSHLSPVQDIEQAFDVIRDLSTNGNVDEMESDMQGGFEKVRKPNRMMDDGESEMMGGM